MITTAQIHSFSKPGASTLGGGSKEAIPFVHFPKFVCPDPPESALLEAFAWCTQAHTQDVCALCRLDRGIKASHCPGMRLGVAQNMIPITTNVACRWGSMLEHALYPEQSRKKHCRKRPGPTTPSEPPPRRHCRPPVFYLTGTEIGWRIQ